jgi:hypothetical protein
LFTRVGVFKRGVVINILLSLAIRFHLGKQHGGFTIQGGGGTSHKEVVVNIFPRVLMKRLTSFTCTNSSWLGCNYITLGKIDSASSNIIIINFDCNLY